jgi:hypothetical protein
MASLYEIWSAGNGYQYLYTENDLVYNLLKKITHNFSRYERYGRVFAWQFLLPKDRMKFIETAISKNKSIEK